MKKLLALLLTLIVCTTCVQALADRYVGADYESGDYGYNLLEDGTAQVTEYYGEASEVVIPSKLDGIPVTSIGYSMFADRYVTQITIPDSVTALDDRAFAYCYYLTRVTIPDSVTAIGRELFVGGGSLTDIVVSPESPVLATIDGVLFSKPDKRLICFPCASAASDYSIPQGIQIIDDWAFDSCFNLTQITIPDSVTAIGEFAFYNCDGLTSIVVGRDSYACQYCIDHDLPYTFAPNDWLND